MKYRRGEISIAIFTLLYLVAFALYFIRTQNNEFLLYVGVVVLVFVLMFATLHRTRFSYSVLAGMSLWGLLHMAGGGLAVNGEVLYALHLIPIVDLGEDLFILKFDQVVHFWGFGVTTLLAYDLLKHYLNDRSNYAVVYPLLVLIGMGLGSLNEIVEFFAVLAFPETGVGGYGNTSLDMVFNSSGAIAAVIIIHFKRKAASK